MSEFALERRGSLALMRWTGAEPDTAALSPAAARELAAALAGLALDPAGVRAVALLDLPAGIPLGRAALEAQRAWWQLARAIEDLPLPVGAILTGTVRGARLALALACDWRIGTERTRIALPDVQMGQLPLGGTALRLARLAGAADALELIISGRSVRVTSRLATPIFDEVVPPGHELSRAGAWASGAGSAGKRPGARRTEGTADGRAFLDAVRRVRAEQAAPKDSPRALAVDLVEAALLLPFSVAGEHEADALARAAGSPQGTALRQLHRAEHLPLPWQEVTGDPGAGPFRGGVGLVPGAGTSFAPLVTQCLEHGVPVTLAGPGAEETAEAVIRQQEEAVRKGRMPERRMHRRLSRLDVAGDVSALGGLGLSLVRADVAGEVPAGQGAWAMLAEPGSVLPPEAALPGTPILRLARPVSRRRAVELRLVEPDDPAARNAAEVVAAFLRRIGRIAAPGFGRGPFALMRLAAAMDFAADELVMQGALPADIDGSLAEAGFARLPFLLRDRLGLARAIERRRAAFAGGSAEMDEPAPLDRWLIEAGRGGASVGGGYYDHGPEGPLPSREVTRILGLSGRGPGSEEIVERVLAALAVEGARLLAEGVLRRAAEIDILSVFGLGVPQEVGGPMLWADLRGLLSLQRRLESWSGEGAAFWRPPELWRRKAALGEHFGVA